MINYCDFKENDVELSSYFIAVETFKANDDDNNAFRNGCKESNEQSGRRALAFHVLHEKLLFLYVKNDKIFLQLCSHLLVKKIFWRKCRERKSRSFFTFPSHIACLTQPFRYRIATATQVKTSK